MEEEIKKIIKQEIEFCKEQENRYNEERNERLQCYWIGRADGVRILLDFMETE